MVAQFNRTIDSLSHARDDFDAHDTKLAAQKAGAEAAAKQPFEIAKAERTEEARVRAENRSESRKEHAIELKDAQFIDKTYIKPANDAEQSFQVFENAYADFKRGADTGAPSMMALSQHLSTTFGTVKGSRVTKDMIAEHLHARSVSDAAEVAIQKFTNGDVLAPKQWDAFRSLISDARRYKWAVAQKEADAKGVDISASVPADLGGKAKPLSAFGGAPTITARNPKTGQRIQSNDGGKTWQPIQ